METRRKYAKKTPANKNVEMAIESFSDGAVNLGVEVTLFGDAIGTPKVYVVGNLPELGGWDVNKAKPLINQDGKFKGHFKVKSGSNVEFKVINKPSWNHVEKGMWGEELENHRIFTAFDTTCDVGVSKWNC